MGIVKAGWNFADNLDVIVLITTLTAFLTYPLLWRPREVLLDDMAEWGMKGPGTPSLSENMRGVYYLSGAKQTSRCNATEQRDRTLCLDGYHRPLAFGFDMSYCKRSYSYTTFQYDTRTISCSGPFLLTSAHGKHSNGRPSWRFTCRDWCRGSGRRGRVGAEGWWGRRRRSMATDRGSPPGRSLAARSGCYSLVALARWGAGRAPAHLGGSTRTRTPPPAQ